MLASGLQQRSAAIAVVLCKTSDSEMRDSFFLFLSLFAQRSALGGWKSKSPSSSSFSSSQFLFRSSAKIYMQSALVPSV